MHQKVVSIGIKGALGHFGSWICMKMEDQVLIFLRYQIFLLFSHSDFISPNHSLTFCSALSLTSAVQFEIMLFVHAIRAAISSVKPKK